MQVEVNRQPRELPEDATVVELLAHLELAHRRVAVEVNREIVPRSEHARRRLADGDRIEIVHAIGGG